MNCALVVQRRADFAQTPDLSASASTLTRVPSTITLNQLRSSRAILPNMPSPSQQPTVEKVTDEEYANLPSTKAENSLPASNASQSPSGTTNANSALNDTLDEIDAFTRFLQKVTAAASGQRPLQRPPQRPRVDQEELNKVEDLVKILATPEPSGDKSTVGLTSRTDAPGS